MDTKIVTPRDPFDVTCTRFLWGDNWHAVGIMVEDVNLIATWAISSIVSSSNDGGRLASAHVTQVSPRLYAPGPGAAEPSSLANCANLPSSAALTLDTAQYVIPDFVQ